MPTDNYNLHTPKKGTEDWHVPLNENFTTIDSMLATLESSDTSTGSGSGPLADALLVDDGTEGFSTIQAAINNLPSNDGGLVFVAPDYNNSDSLPITIDRAADIRGFGMRETILDFSKNTSDVVFDISVNNALGDTVSYHGALRNMRIKGGNVGLSIEDNPGFLAENVWWENQESHNIEFLHGNNIYSVFRDCVMDDAGGTGVQMDHGGGIVPNATEFRNCLVANSGNYGINAYGGNVVISGGAVETTSSAGIKTTGVPGAVVIIGTYFEGCAADESGGFDDCDVSLATGGAPGGTVLGTWHQTPGPEQGIKIVDTAHSMVGYIRGPNSGVTIEDYCVDPVVGPVSKHGNGITASRSATRPTVNALAHESANAEMPNASNWQVGQLVEFTDSDDGSGDGIYVLDFNGSWRQLS